MSVIKVDTILNKDGTGGPILSGLTTVGILTGALAIGATSLYAETVNAIGTVTSNTVVDVSDGNVQTVRVGGNCEFSFTNEPASGIAGTITLLITDGGSNTTTWEAAVKWPGNVAPALTASGIDILSFITIDGGTTIYGFVGGINFS